MTIRKVVPLALCALTLCGMDRAFAQNAPFTIRRPPDGSTVREKVRIEIPRDSIAAGGFVAFFIDDKFHSALAPQEDRKKPFTFVWDTKDNNIADGEHTVRAVLFEPASGGNANAVAVEEKEASEVKLTVANKIKNGPKTLTLRYKFRDGSIMEYARNSKSLVVGGLSASGITTSDQTLNEMKSKLLLGVEDSRPYEDIALVRNKLTSLSVLEQGQEITFPEEQLPGSMYQELTSQGRVKYEMGTGISLASFVEQGLSINNTLELPLLPPTRITVGQTWRQPGQRLDIPGVPPAQQPRVTLTSKFEGLEWESGYPTAKIRQTYEGELGKTMLFNGVEVTTPKVNYERDIYIAYKSGTLVKIKRSLTVSGRTSSELGAPPDLAAAGGGGAPYGGRFSGPAGPGGPMAGGPMTGGMSMPPGMGAASGAPYGGRRSGFSGPGGPSRGPYGGSSGPPSGYGGPSGGSRGPYGGSSGPPSGYGGMISGAGRQAGGKLGSAEGIRGAGASSSPYGGIMSGGMRGGIRGGAMGGAGTQETDHPITLRYITETQILPAGSKAP